MNILLRLFREFFKIGAFTFGGGYAMLPLIMEAVDRNGWLTEEQMLNFIAISESTPGPFAVNIATYIGTETAGFVGAMIATLGVVTPSFIIILIVAKCLEMFKESVIVKGMMKGLRPVTVGLIASAFISTGKLVFLPGVTSFGSFREALTPDIIVSIGTFGIAFLLIRLKKHPILIIVISAIIGIIWGFIREKAGM